jgi:hypothetical protein
LSREEGLSKNELVYIRESRVLRKHTATLGFLIAKFLILSRNLALCSGGRILSRTLKNLPGRFVIRLFCNLKIGAEDMEKPFKCL